MRLFGRRRRGLGWISAAMAVVLVMTSSVPNFARAQDQNLIGGEEAAPVESVSADPGLADEAGVSDDALEAEQALDPAEAQRIAESASAGIPSTAEPASLPTGEAKSAVTPQAISLPNAEGSIEGMGESFAPILSSGTATFSIPIALPAGRAGVQPSLALSYSSTGGNGDVGLGWSMAVPFISRQTDRGLPRYVDGVRWHAQEDRFLYNGGQELVPVDDAVAERVDCGETPESEAPCTTAPVPDDLRGWQQYRARVEGAFMRFFRSRDSRRWVVQSKDGSRFDFGVLSTAEGPSDVVARSTAALQTEQPGGAGRVFRWLLTRMSDAHGSTVYYRYVEGEGQRYLSDIHYLSPASCASASPVRDCSEELSSYGRRVRLSYDRRPDVFTSYVSGWRVATALRLSAVEVYSAGEDAGERFQVRRYLLSYHDDVFHSLLAAVQIQGRPQSCSTSQQVCVGDAEATESDAWTGEMLPPLTFSYTDTPSGPIEGFGGIDGEVHESGASPPHSVDEGRADLFDVNSDGLPDLIVTDPARYRTRDGEPAVGVFFNGFDGDRVSAGQAGAFSNAVAMPMPGGESTAMNLANLNVVPMDIDGDGRGDLLHMPRAASYGFFAPTRFADPDGAPFVSPAEQGWRWSRASVSLPGGTDPRIDFGRDAEHLRVLDVNNDHLVDVVRTTGTVMQTWLNLGFVPATRGTNDGKFGQARWTGTTWEISPDPIESCLLHAGTPVDFEDREIQLADMNGDGLQDIVKIRRGYVAYWPGRGTGLWGEGDGATCARGDGEGREIVMSRPPAEVNPELAGVFVEDVNADGAADVVQVRFDAVDVWFNQAGASFTTRVITDGTPAAPDFAPRVRFADIDGTGTTDIVFGNADRWRWIDPMGGQRPRLLQVVDNGLGAVTSITYASSAEDYLSDLRDAASCPASDEDCARFTWSRAGGTACPPQFAADLDAAGACFRSGGSPVVSTVVRSVATSDRFSNLRVAGRSTQVSQTDFGYHDGYYEGIEQEFRGFGCADAAALGDPNHPTAITRTCFHQGRRPAALESVRLENNPDEALKGREIITEVTNEGGIYLSTQHATYTVRTLMPGLDGRMVDYAFVSRSDQLVYDTSDYGAPGAGVEEEVDEVRRETVDSATGDVPETATVEAGGVRPRNANYVVISSSVDLVDNTGNMWRQTALGREGIDEPIISNTEPVLVDDDSWLWRTARTWITGSVTTLHLGETVNTYTATGDLSVSVQDADIASAFTFDDDVGIADEPAEGFTQDDQDLVASTAFDTWGNALVTCGGTNLYAGGSELTDCLRAASVEYDEAYAQLPIVEAIATAPDGSDFTTLATEATWDRGLGALLTATDPNGAVTEVGYDGFGRLTYVETPNAANCSSTAPLTRIEYDITDDPIGEPVSVVTTYTERGCAGIGNDQGESRAYVDGLGRVRATLTSAESAWLWSQRGVNHFTARGTEYAVWDPTYLRVMTPSIAEALALPTSVFGGMNTNPVGTVEVRRDAFGRTIRDVAQDGVESETRYGLLEVQAWDPLDLDSSHTFHDTPAITRFDGHGRVVDQVLHNLQADGTGEEFYRLYTTYRADGAVLTITRGQSSDADPGESLSPSVSRTFTYDTVGRRIAATDPDTDSRTNTDAASKTWRYLFNAVGDLVAVRDPRQCGQNFYYDRAGRLIGEDYVECGPTEMQTAGENPDGDDEVPDGSVALGAGDAHFVDVRYFFDDIGEVAWATGDLVPGTSEEAGRLVAISDRGQRSTLTYDARGNVVRTARVMAVISDAGDVDATLSDPPTVETSDEPTPGTRIYDTTHVYVRTAKYDHAGRNKEVVYPTDPDWALFNDPMDTDTAPVVKGTAQYKSRSGRLSTMSIYLDGTLYRNPIAETNYRPDDQAYSGKFGDDKLADGTSHPRTSWHRDFDVRNRVTEISSSRTRTGAMGVAEPNNIGNPIRRAYVWDDANNLTTDNDISAYADRINGHRTQRTQIAHDALYRVTGATFTYKPPSGGALTTDTADDWRGEVAAHVAADPMRAEPAPMLATEPTNRVAFLNWRYDWLGNMTRWDEDKPSTTGTVEPTQFYERGLGAITNGSGLDDPNDRPSALYFASNLPTSNPSSFDAGIDRGGWLDLQYGEGGNVIAMTVRTQCHDIDTSNRCYTDATETDLDDRRTFQAAHCECENEQHYQYRWDELNRLHEARRYDREGGTGDWVLFARQRYRYDAANVRTLKQSLIHDGDELERITLYVHPGDFERRGLVRDIANEEYDADSALGTETQYLIAGARMVWQTRQPLGYLERTQRTTVAIGDLLGSTTAVIDLETADLLSLGTFYPNGAQENLWVQQTELMAHEPLGFTGKEEDLEVGLTYFGERYLISRIGRWCTPDPLATHAVGGGEAGNAYHYVSGSLLQAADAVGLSPGEDRARLRQLRHRHGSVEGIAQGIEEMGVGRLLAATRAAPVPGGVAGIHTLESARMGMPGYQFAVEWFARDQGNPSPFRENLSDNANSQGGHFLSAVANGYHPELVANTPLLGACRTGCGAAGVIGAQVLPTLREALAPDSAMSDLEFAMRLVIGHELQPDPGEVDALTAGDYIRGRWGPQFNAVTNADVVTFANAVNYVTSLGANGTVDYDQLDAILAPLLARAGTGHGNSPNDVRNTTVGFAFGMMSRHGEFANDAAGAAWVRRNVAGPPQGATPWEDSPPNDGYREGSRGYDQGDVDY